MDAFFHGIAVLAATVAVFLSALFGTTAMSFERSFEDVTRSPERVTAIFGGDMMFDRTVRTAINKNGGDFIFSCIDSVLKSADFTVANLEGPITDNPSVSATSSPGDEFNYTFTFAPATGELLARHGIRIVNIGNNHITNFRAAGVRSTTDVLRRAGVEYFGDPFGQSVATTSVHGVTLAFINYNQFSYSSTADLTMSQVRAARAAGEIPVVYAHWGEEYMPATDDEKTLAHNFIDAGAEIVIGSHPHVIQEHEIYAGKNIYYSLGNLFFDQYWNADVRTGLLLEVTFTKNGVGEVKEQRVELEHDRRTCPIAAATLKAE